MVGDKKQTIQEKDSLYKESYEYLMPRSEKNPNGGKIEVVAEKIARFAKRALQFDGKNLYGGLGELADPLKKFVETLKVLMKNPIVNVKTEYSEQSEEKKKESKYNVGQKYIYTDGKGDKRVVTLVSKTHVMKMGDDKKWATKDDAEGGKLPKEDTLSVVYDDSKISFGVSKSDLSPYVDQKARETKYKKDELIKDIESATKKALELKKDNPKKAKILANIDKMKADLDKLDESVNESVYISKLMEIQAGMRVIMLELNEALKSSSKPVGRLLKFDRFMSYIKEAEEPVTTEETPESTETQGSTSASDPRSSMSRVERIQDYFERKCRNVKDYTMDKTEFEKVRANFEKLEKDKDGFIIDGYDPIIEILKLFNRAYKLYMAKYITKRSTGPGVSTEAEYTSFGDKGPYRNDKIFDVWENAVLDLMKDRKYEFIFDPKTNLRVGNEIRPNGGANLRKFMTDMLDGDSLYKSKSGYGDSGRGKQAELLDEYFGKPDEKIGTAINKGGTFLEKDEENNQEIVEGIEASATKIKATKSENAVSDDGKKAVYPVKYTFFVLKIKDKDGNEAQRAFYIQEIDGAYAYMQCSKNFGTFNPLLDASVLGHANNLVGGDLQVKESKALSHFTKVKRDDFLKLLLSPGTIEVGMMSADGQKKITTEKIEVIGAYWITKEVDGKNVLFNAIEFGKEIGKDKEKVEKLNKQIAKVAGISTIVNMINGSDASKVEITRA